jgi:hypothetical protein
MRSLIAIVAALVVAPGCTTTGSSVSGNGGSTADVATVEVGVVTVADLYRRSDIAILAPAQEHVVWRRSTDAVSGRAVVMDRAPPKVRPASVAIAAPVAPVDSRPRWPLLREDGNPASQIGVLAMCTARNSGCESTACYRALEPCEQPERYDCVEGKKLDYCVEKRTVQTAEVKP